MPSGHTRSRTHWRLLTGASKPALAALLLVMQPGLVLADITNTVTVTGSSPGGTDDVTATGGAAVTPVLAAPGVTVAKTASFTDTGSPGAEVGDVITYTYDVTNSGNTYLTNVSVTDAHTGTGSLSAITLAATPLTDNAPLNDPLVATSSDNGSDAVWDQLAPGDVVHFTATYTVTAADVSTAGGGDGVIENTVTANANYNDGTTSVPQTNTDTASVPLLVNKSMTVAKTASPSTGAVAGTVVTYTYVVTNTGNVPITNIQLSDAHNGTGTPPVPDNETLSADNGTAGDSTDAAASDGIWSVLAPGDAVTFSATYTVTQSDVDTLQ